MIRNFGAGLRQVAICFLLLASATMLASTYSVIAVPLSQEFQTSRMVLMLSMTVMAGSTALMAPFAGTMLDRLSLRGMMLLGCALLAGGHFALSYVTSFNEVLVIYALMMAPAGILIGPIAATVLLSRWFVKRRGSAIGIAIAGVSMGAVLYPPVIQALLDGHHWREALRLLSLVIICCTVPAALLVVNRPSDRGLHPDGADSDPEADRSSQAAPNVALRTLLADPTFWLVALVVMVITSGLKGLATNFVPIARDEGIAPDVAALLLSSYAACGVMAKLLFAAVADRMSLRVILFMMLGGFATGMAVMTQAHGGFWVIAVGTGLIGLFGAAMVAMQSVLVARIFGQRVVGRVMGIISTVLLVGSLLTPPLFGRIFDVTGSYSAIFMVFAGLALASMFAVPYIRLHPKEAEPAPAVAAVA
jgi:predicted MFS family arabinose efflux permease